MPKTISTITILVFSLLLFSGIFANPVLATDTKCVTGKTLEGQDLPSEFSQEWQNCFGLEQTVENSEIKNLEVIKPMPLGIIGNILGLALSFLGIIFFLVIIAAGIIWMMAMGSPEKAEKAKDMLEAAVIGLIIILGAYAITKFVFKSIGADKAPEFVGQTATNQDCSKLQAGQDCSGKEASGKKVINMVCNNDKVCVSKCEYKWPKTGECVDLSGGKSCSTGKTKADNYCPSPNGNVNNKCCHGND